MALFDFFSKKGGSVLGIDLGSSSIKVVQLRKNGARAVLETYGELALGPYANLSIGRATSLSSESLSVALTDLLKEAATTTRTAGLSIPLGASLTTLIELPELPEKELNAVIPIEARKYIPVPISEVALDWWVIPKSKESFFLGGEKKEVGPQKVEILIIAIHNTFLQKYQEIVNKTQLSSTFFELETFSTIRAVASQEIAPVMIFDMGAATTKLYVVDRGVVRSSHIIPRGSQDITIALSKSLDMSVEKAEQTKRTAGLTGDPAVTEVIALTLEYILGEASRVLVAYEKKYSSNVGKIILTGGGVLLNGLFERAKETFQAEVIYTNPFSRLEAPAFLEPVLKRAGPEFAVSIGIALRKLQEMA